MDVIELNRTHDATARSWLVSANVDGCDFPIQNLPFGVFREAGSDRPFRGGVAIGDQVLDLAALSAAGGFSGEARSALNQAAQPTLNGLMALGPFAWRALRHALFDALSARSEAAGSPSRPMLQECLVPMSAVEMNLPVRIGNYSDFYTSLHHAVNIGKLFGLPDVSANFKTLPIAYHGRASTVKASGQVFSRPFGQISETGQSSPMLSPTRKLDYELELGIFIGSGNQPGVPIPVGSAEDQVFGICLLNDWSARDIQAWEMQPLGPFLSKSFATTVSPWIVTMEALAPFRLPAERPVEDPPLLAYLDSARNRHAGSLDIELEVLIESALQRERRIAPHRLAATNFRHQYWTVAQMVAHHSINGCALEAGDLLGSGTISGPQDAEAGAMMELAKNGAAPVTLPTGEQRSFIQDGDAVVFRGHCNRAGFATIGFGECRGQVEAPLATNVDGSVDPVLSAPQNRK